MEEKSAAELTRKSWNLATRNHNAHKGDQARFLRDGGELLFSEELELLGTLTGRKLVHLQCNAGQDTLCLARRGAVATGVDFADEAIAFARQLSTESRIPATFVESELLLWLASTAERFDIAFSSYGAVGWIPSLNNWANGISRVLSANGRFVLVEFHPFVWSLEGDRLGRDSYFDTKPFREPVSNYVAESGAGLGGVVQGETVPNSFVATSYQHTLAAILTALAGAGLRLETLREYPYSNGCRVLGGLELDAQRRWRFAAGKTQVPLMFGVVFSKPS